MRAAKCACVSNLVISLTHVSEIHPGFISLSLTHTHFAARYIFALCSIGFYYLCLAFSMSRLSLQERIEFVELYMKNHE